MCVSRRMTPNVSICVRAGLPKPRGVPDTERTKDTKTLDYASTPLDANTLLGAATVYTYLLPLELLCRCQMVHLYGCQKSAYQSFSSEFYLLTF